VGGGLVRGGEEAGWCDGGGPLEEGGGGGKGELHVLWAGGGGVVRGWVGDGGVLVDGGGRDGVHEWGAGGRARDGGGALATVGAVRQLVVVETASQFGLLEVGGDVLVGHLLKTSLEEIDFLLSRLG